MVVGDTWLDFMSMKQHHDFLHFVVDRPLAPRLRADSELYLQQVMASLSTVTPQLLQLTSIGLPL
jgi:hypothetical protein